MRTFLTILITSFLLQGCASSLEGDVYTREEAQKAMSFRWGTVETTRPVIIEGDRSAKGQVAGAVIGGAAGYGVTDSRTRALTSAVGAVAGAIAGQMAEEKMTRAQGLEITLKLDDGQHVVIVQEVENVDEFTPGNRVKVISGQGKLRVSR
jgi:outer membrane lipoprotein SlyB